MCLPGSTSGPTMRSDLKRIVFKSGLVVGPEVVSGTYMHCLILLILVERNEQYSYYVASRSFGHKFRDDL